MKPGIYHVTFASFLQQDQSDGLAVVKDNAINGGDLGYIYRGSFKVTGTKIAATLNIRRWNQYAVSIFGNIATFDLEIEGQVSSDLTSFSGQGFVVQNRQMRLTFNARRLDDAA
jgi:hypothetical protein